MGAETIRELHDRLATMARERNVVRGSKLRMDTTVVESNIHYPTASGLLNDGFRVLTRTMKEIERMAGGVGNVARQTKARIFEGLTQLPDKIVSLFEPHTEIIRKGKAGKPNEFGKLVQ